jgi:hypothetical protein
MFLIQRPGELELWVDGKLVISVGGLILRVNTASRFQGAHFETFFGGKTSAALIINTSERIVGHTEDWASPKDQRAWFANVSGAILG